MGDFSDTWFQRVFMYTFSLYYMKVLHTQVVMNTPAF